ncbi:MAG TPA: ATP-binding protein [Gemmatimonadaceae bacterium]
MTNVRTRLLPFVGWTLALAACAAAMYALRPHLGSAHITLLLLLVVLFGSAAHGRAVGLWLATLSFVVFDVLFIPPYGTLAVRDPLDWLVLAVFLTTSVVAAQLLYRAQEQARVAEALAAERVRLVAEAEHASALREADRLKDALLAAVSHDLRTPLTTIKALAHDLSALGDERAEIIEHEADRLNRVVADLLELSRLNAGALALHVEVNAVDDLLGALLQQVEPAMPSRRIDVRLPPDDPLLLGKFDLVHTVRVLVNLVENAAKYSPADAPIEITASRRGDTLEVSVADRGGGIPAGEVDRVFEPFYRPPGSPPDVGGTGLGLSIARRLAEAQGGQLTYAPRGGGGSVFTLALPGSSFVDADANRGSS